MPNRPQTHRPFPNQQRQTQADYDRRRGPDRQFYGTARWRRFRECILLLHPVCQGTWADGRPCCEPATEVDHLKDRREFPDLAFVEENVQALCKSCHSRITRQREGHRPKG